jgi:predicted Zn finger-like uncharacterized protein
MIITCEKCGKKYQVDPEQIKGETAQFRCESCQNIITVSKNANNPPLEAISQPPAAETEKTAPPASKPRGRGIGLRGKTFFLFFFIPICLFVAAGLLYLDYMRSLAGLITEESSQLVTKMAEESVAEKARAVAREVRMYLATHPDLEEEEFSNDPGFMGVAIQKVGVTGYTFVVSRPTDTEPSIMVANPRPEMIGINITKAMEETLGKEYERWLKIHGKPYEVGGYYTWVDGREKYQFSVPIEGTTLNAVSSAYLDEFTLPMEHLKAQANQMTLQATRTVTIILVATAILIAFFVIFYSYRLSGRLKALSAAADSISVGNLDVEIKGRKSRDEIGVLANDLSRMQTSIQLAIRRLRERR